MSGKGLIEQIKHYQKDIERCPDNSERMIRCIQRLYVLPVLVEHLQETGVGRSVNSLRKYNGEVGNAAKALVAKWKAMVAAEEVDEPEKPPEIIEHKKREKNHRDSQKDKSDSHKDKSSDRHKRKHVENGRNDKHHTSKRSHSEIKHDKHVKNRDKKHKHVEIKEESMSEKSSESDSESDSSSDDDRPVEKSDSESSQSSDSESSSDNRHKHNKSSHKHRHESHKKHSHKEIKTEKQIKKEKNDKHSKKSSVKIERNEDGSIDQGSGASFADALLGVSYPPKKKKKTDITPPSKSRSSHSSPSSSKKSSKHLDFTMPEALTKPITKSDINLDISSTLPEILPTYKPLPHVPESFKRISKSTSEEDALISVMTTKNLRTKVYSGGKTGTYLQVPSLYELCLQLLFANIDALEFTGGVPYDILKPLLQKLNADQLFVLEHYNPYLVEETDELWQFHCRKDFRGEKLQEMESYRDLYLRCMDERERKLKAVTTNINHAIAKSTPVRTAKLAYIDSVVKPPRNVARNQARYGTASSSRSSSEAKQQLLAKAVIGGHTPGVLATTVVPAPPHSVSRNAPIQTCNKKKKAPLMAKALQLIKVNRFKR